MSKGNPVRPDQMRNVKTSSLQYCTDADTGKKTFAYYKSKERPNKMSHYTPLGHNLKRKELLETIEKSNMDAETKEILTGIIELIPRELIHPQ